MTVCVRKRSSSEHLFSDQLGTDFAIFFKEVEFTIITRTCHIHYSHLASFGILACLSEKIKLTGLFGRNTFLKLLRLCNLIQLLSKRLHLNVSFRRPLQPHKLRCNLLLKFCLTLSSLNLLLAFRTHTLISWTFCVVWHIHNFLLMIVLLSFNFLIHLKIVCKNNLTLFLQSDRNLYWLKMYLKRQLWFFSFLIVFNYNLVVIHRFIRLLLVIFLPKNIT